MGSNHDSTSGSSGSVRIVLHREARETDSGARARLRRRGIAAERPHAQHCAEDAAPPPSHRDRNAGRMNRRQTPIHAYIGANGGGKSLAMVHDTLPSLDAGRKVLSTVRLLDSRTGESHPAYEPLTDWGQLLEAEHCDVLFDEVVGIASARESQGMPVQVANLLVQLRRRDVVLRWSAPAWARADKIIRETTQAVTVCSGYLGKRVKDSPRLWAPKRLFKWSTYDALDFDQASTGQIEKQPHGSTSWFWGVNSRAFASYDTFDSVERVGEVLDSGRCVHCGGRRVIPRCSCD